MGEFFVDKTILGHGWVHSYESALDPSYEIGAGSFVKIIDETGRAAYFKKQGVSHYGGVFGERSHVEAEGGGYVWYRLNGTRYSFTASGKLSWIEDEKGNRLTLGYDGEDLLETVTDGASGRVLTFHYNANDLLDYISGPVTSAVADGIWVEYAYDGNQNLTSVTYADDSGFTYIYRVGQEPFGSFPP